MNRVCKREWSVFLFLMLAFGLVLLYLAYHEAVQITKTQTQRFDSQTNVLSKVISLQLDSTRHTLINIRKDVENELRDGGSSNGKIQNKINNLIDASVSIFAISILDRSGSVLISTQNNLIGLNFAERDYFKIPKTNPHRDMLYISPPFKNIFGSWSLCLTVSFFDNTNKFAGVITAILDPKILKIILSSFQHAPDVYISLAHQSGILFISQPDDDWSQSGKNLAIPGSFFSRHIQSRSDLTISKGVVFATGEDRLMAIRTIKKLSVNADNDLLIAIGRSRGAIYSSYKRETLIHVIIYFVIVVSSGLLLLVYQKKRDYLIAEKTVFIQNLQSVTENLNNFFEISPDLLCIISIDGVFVKVNSVWKQVLGYSKPEMEGKQFINFVHKDDIEDTINAMIELQAKAIMTDFVNRYCHKNGSYRYIEWKSVLLENFIYCSARDITEKKLAELNMEKMVYKDTITGLLNRAGLFKQLNHAIEFARDSNKMVGVLFIDLDGFKNVNDKHGHAIGDAVLATTASRLLSAVRSTDIVSRTGGDEFVVILCNITNSFETGKISQKIIQKISESIVINEDTSITVGASIGISLFPENGKAVDELLLVADAAMYLSKKNGKNRFTFAGTERDQIVKKSCSMLDSIPLLGFDQIDSQHKDMAQAVLDTQTALVDNMEVTLVEKIFEKLISSATENFNTESSLMTAFGYKGIDSHNKAHEELLLELSLIKKQLSASGHSFIFSTLDRWLCNHILSEDKDLVDFLNKKTVLINS